MSGIVSFVNLNGEVVSSKILKGALNTLMNRKLKFSYFLDKNVGLGYKGFEKLVPLSNENEEMWMVSDGQIYNFNELKKILESKGHKFKSSSSLEVILHAYEEFGIKCLEKFNGMFAFVILDKKKNRIFCARDRFGIKPFYYIFDSNGFYIASEIKALINEGFKKIPNKECIYHYLVYDCIDHLEETFFRGIKRLLPSHYMILDLKSKKIGIKKYWDLNPDNILKDSKLQNSISRFYELFENSVKLRLKCDSNLGSTLSGGLDSSSIVSIGSEILGRKKLKTFSTVIEYEKYTESGLINSVAKKTGVINYRTYPKIEELSKDLNKIIWCQEEPTNSSVLVHWALMKLAKKHNINTLLCGSGGDETLGGYPKYFGYFFEDLIKSFKMSKFLTESALFLKHNIKMHGLLYSFLNLFPYSFRNKFKGVKGWLRGYENSKHIYFKRYRSCLINDMYNDLISGIPGELRMEGKNAMAFSLELRNPFLDHRLVEYNFSLPINQKICNGSTKFILRNAMKNALPKNVLKIKRKMGFSSPENQWIREISNDIYEIINSKMFKSRGFFDIKKINRDFDSHIKLKKDLGSDIWKWVNLELWHRVFIDE